MPGSVSHWMTDAVRSHCFVPSGRIVGSRTWLPFPFVSAGNFAVTAASTSRICSAVMEAPAEGLGAPEPPAAVTITSPFMPASAWPGTEHRNVRPAAGMTTSPVADWCASALIAVPSAKVTLCVMPPSFLNVTV